MGGLTAICIGSFYISIQKFWDLGWGGFYKRGWFCIRGKRLAGIPYIDVVYVVGILQYIVCTVYYVPYSTDHIPCLVFSDAYYSRYYI